MTDVNYPTPVLVNGFRCRNCTDVDYAKKHIDPQHPKDGPYGINRTEPTGDNSLGVQTVGQTPAVIFGGQLANATQQNGAPRTDSPPPARALDIKV